MLFLIDSHKKIYYNENQTKRDNNKRKEIKTDSQQVRKYFYERENKNKLSNNGKIYVY